MYTLCLVHADGRRVRIQMAPTATVADLYTQAADANGNAIELKAGVPPRPLPTCSSTTLTQAGIPCNAVAVCTTNSNRGSQQLILSKYFLRYSANNNNNYYNHNNNYNNHHNYNNHNNYNDNHYNHNHYYDNNHYDNHHYDNNHYDNNHYDYNHHYNNNYYDNHHHNNNHYDNHHNNYHINHNHNNHDQRNQLHL